jgi:hypothetical protein
MGAVAWRHARGLARRPGWTSARALVRGSQGPLGARTGELASLPLRLVVHVIGCRGEPATMGRAVTHQAPVTTRRPPLPSSASSGHDDTARHNPQAHGLRARTSPAQRRPLRCRGGAGRWAIRWATPRRIGPYQAQCRALSGTADCADLQVFRCLEAPRTPRFTRERTLVRNQPRPSKRVPFSRHFAVKHPNYDRHDLAGASACWVVPTSRTRGPRGSHI